ncbi:hypothetical protein O9993_21395 [Vibrio lentus]|nr:hypothetical protein [Vibrio lentus]
MNTQVMLMVMSLLLQTFKLAQMPAVQDNDSTFTKVVPSADFNGELDLTFDISDIETISSAIDLTVRPINDAPVPEDKTLK